MWPAAWGRTSATTALTGRQAHYCHFRTHSPFTLMLRALPGVAARLGPVAALRQERHGLCGSPTRLRVRVSTTTRLLQRPDRSVVMAAWIDEEDNVYEPARKAKARARREPKVKVSAPTVQAALDGEITEEGKNEGAVLSFLALLFAAILVEGLLVAGSGFLSDDMDQLIQDTVFKAFSPSVGLFLTVSSGYGLWKTKFAGKGTPNETPKDS